MKLKIPTMTKDHKKCNGSLYKNSKEIIVPQTLITKNIKPLIIRIGDQILGLFFKIGESFYKRQHVLTCLVEN